MRLPGLVCLLLASPAFAQAAPSAGSLAVSAVLQRYTVNPLVHLPDTQQTLPATGKWSMRAGRPESCPLDDTPCVRVVYAVPDAHATCEWTVQPRQDAATAVFLDQNEDASRYFLRLLPAAELAPLVLASAQPVYPPIARAAHVSGAAVVRLVVSDKGVVTSATPVSGPTMLLRAATDAAQKWSFHPLQVGTQATPFSADLHADFSLPGDTSSAAKCTKASPCWGYLPAVAVSMHP